MDPQMRKGERRYLDIKVKVRGRPASIWGSDCRGAQIVSP